MSKYNFYINGQLYNPINIGDLKLDFKLSRDGGSFQYVKTLSGDMKFDGKAYVFIDSHSDCQKIKVEIEVIKQNVKLVIWKGRFTNRDCEFDRDNKTVTVSTKEDSLYQDVIDNYDRKFNVLEATNIVSSKYITDLSRIEYKSRGSVFTDPRPPYYSGTVIGFGSGNPFFPLGVVCRETKTVYCRGGQLQPPKGGGWSLLVDNCAKNFTSTWERAPLVFDGVNAFNMDTSGCVTPNCIPPPPPVTANNEDWFLMTTRTISGSTLGFWIDNNDLIAAANQVTFNNGRLLTDVINLLLNKINNSIDLQSRFLFDDANPITGNAPSSTNKIQVHSISDIKDPEATEKATLEKVSLRDILEGYIVGKLNCYWRVDEETKRLIIEHISEIDNQGTFDLTAIENGKYIKSRNNVKYDKTDIPKAEEFPSNDVSIDFTGVDIDFNNPCSEGVKTYRTDQFYSEVEEILTNPEEYPKDGLVMITPNSMYPQGLSDEYSAGAENGLITGDYYPNAPQGMANLHDKFWKYNRPFPNGVMNFNTEEFKDNRAVKQSPSVSVPLCCISEFNPYAKIKGANFDKGQLQSASFDLISNFITLETNYYE